MSESDKGDSDKEFNFVIERAIKKRLKPHNTYTLHITVQMKLITDELVGICDIEQIDKYKGRLDRYILKIREITDQFIRLETRSDKMQEYIDYFTGQV